MSFTRCLLTVAATALLTAPLSAQVTLLSENFDSLPLMTSVDEPDDGGPKVADAWTPNPPQDWVINNQGSWTDTITLDKGERVSDGTGVTEWEGWSFADPTFWNDVAGQNRDLFTSGSGVVAIADGDEWDDINGPAPDSLMDTTLSTPSVDVSGYPQVTLAFDSSWRDEEPQEGTVSVVFDDGDPIELLHYTGGVTGDKYNENLSFTIDTNGASSMVVDWRYFNADNDWWWAIDNVSVAGVPEPATFGMSCIAGLAMLFTARLRRRK